MNQCHNTGNHDIHPDAAQILMKFIIEYHAAQGLLLEKNYTRTPQGWDKLLRVNRKDYDESHYEAFKDGTINGTLNIIQIEILLYNKSIILLMEKLDKYVEFDKEETNLLETARAVVAKIEEDDCGDCDS